MGTLLVLLRGINVGGKNVIPMRDLQGSFIDMGFTDPVTYIQSGNVVVGSRRANGPRVVHTIERGLSGDFGYQARVVVKDLGEMTTVVRQVPRDWDVEDTTMRYNVLFTTRGLTPSGLLSQVSPKPGIETIKAGTHAVYWAAPFETLRKTAMIKFGAHPSYAEITVRNLRTTRTLLDLMRQHADRST